MNRFPRVKEILSPQTGTLNFVFEKCIFTFARLAINISLHFDFFLFNFSRYYGKKKGIEEVLFSWIPTIPTQNYNFLMVHKLTYLYLQIKQKNFFCIPVPEMSISTISRHKIAGSYTQIYKPPFCNSKRNTIYAKFHPFAEYMHRNWIYNTVYIYIVYMIGDHSNRRG